MPLVEWKAEYSVGSREIDQQHQRLFGLINRLHESMRSGSTRETTAGIIDELVSYTRYHFQREEDMLALAGYPELEAHRQRHRAMMAEVERFRDEVDQSSATTPIKLMAFLKNWLSRHILETDMRYRSHI